MLQLNTSSNLSGKQGFDEIAIKVFHGHSIRTNCNMVCLTDLWKATGASDYCRPKNYLSLDRTKLLASSIIASDAKGLKSSLYHTTRGRGGVTWAIEELALDYCKWVSPEIHAWALMALKRQIQEERNPELKVVRGLDAAKSKCKKLGMSDEWIDGRIGAIVTFHQLNGTLGEHGCKEAGDYAMVHGAINRGLLGKSSSQIKLERGVKTTRDGLDAYELNMLALTQMATKQNVDAKNLNGSYQIAAEANSIGSVFRNALQSVLAKVDR